MAAPLYRCPFKVDPVTQVGMVCENTNCAAYDGDEEHCGIVLFYRQRNEIDNTAFSPNNT